MRQASEYIVFPLDVASAREAETWVEMLSPHVGMFKVGLELFVQSGPEIVRMIRRAGAARIFLDLKLHDIPVTVCRTMERIADLGVALTTVHCGESPAMLKAAVQGGAGRVGVLAVTVLTSVSGSDIRQAGFEPAYADNIPELVVKRAAMAQAAGCAGAVCSAQEVRSIKQRLGPEFIVVTPGIRPSWQTAADDQKRLATPAQAVINGSDYLVIGRPIRDAEDPVKAAARIASEIHAALPAKGHQG